MTGSSGSTANSQPPPSIKAGTVAPGEVAGFPEGSTTKVQAFWRDVAPTLWSAGKGMMGGIPTGVSKSGGIASLPGMKLNPDAFTVSPKVVNLNPRTAALRSLSTFNF